MAYRAEIEIIAKGATRVTQLQKGLNQLAVQIDHLNGPGSLGDFNKQLAQAAKLMSRAQQGTVEEKRAVEQYVTALKNANEAQERTNRLVAEEIRQRDGATASLKRYNAAAAAATQRGAATTMSGAYLRGQPIRGETQYSGPIGPGPASARPFGPIGGPSSPILGGQSSLVAERISRNLANTKEQRALQKALLDLEKKSAKVLNEKLEVQQEIAKETQKVFEVIRKQQNLERRQRFLSGRSQYATAIGPQPDRVKMLKRQAILDRTVQRTKELSGLQQNLAKLTRTEANARLDAARNAAQQKGEQVKPFLKADWNGETTENDNTFITAIGSGTTYPDYKPAPFIFNSKVDGADFITVVTEAIFSYCGVKIKIDTYRHLGSERAIVRHKGEAIGHVMTSEYGSQMLSLGGVDHLTGGTKIEGRVTCEALMNLCNKEAVELSIDEGLTVIVQAGKPPIIEGIKETKMRV